MKRIVGTIILLAWVVLTFAQTPRNNTSCVEKVTAAYDVVVVGVVSVTVWLVEIQLDSIAAFVAFHSTVLENSYSSNVILDGRAPAALLLSFQVFVTVTVVGSIVLVTVKSPIYPSPA